MPSLIATTAAVLLTTGLARADPVRVEAVHQGDGAQVLLAWPAPVSLSSETRNGRLYVSFDRPVESDFWAIRTLRRFTGLPTVSDDGKSLTFPLKRQIHAVASVEGPKVVIRFRSAKAPGRIAPAHQVQAPPTEAIAGEARDVNVSTGQHAGFTRIVFDWPEPVGYSIEGAPGQVTVVFDRPAEFDARQFKRKNLKYLQGGETERLGDSTKVTLKVPAGSSFRDMRENHKVVVEILAPSKSTEIEAPTTAADPPAETQSLEASSKQVADPRPSPASGATEPPPALPTAPAGESIATSLPSSPPPVVAKQQTQETSLRFTWDRQVAAALFRRGETLWCIFDAPSEQDVAALATAARPGVRVQQQRHEKATVLSISGEAGLAPRLEREGMAWILRLGADGPASAGGQSITAVAEFSTAVGPRLLLPVPEPGAPVAVADPEIGDTLVVVPVIPPASRMAATRTYPQFLLLASLQGIVVQPLIDSLRVRSLRDGVEITSVDRLLLSPPDGSPAAGLPATATDPQRLLDAHDWMEGPAAGFAARRQALERAATRSIGADRERNRLRLAQFLLGQRFSAEALGVLTLAAEQRPSLAEEPKFLLLRGAAQLLSGRSSQARDDLARAAASGGDEARMWAAATAVVGEAPQDLSRLAQWTAIIAGYPAQLREPLSVWLAEAAIDGGVGKEAEQLIGSASAEAKTAEARAQVAFLQGVRKQKAGDVEGALASFAQAAEIDPRRGRARGELARTLLLRQQDRLSLEQAITALEGLRFAWRGDALEYRLLRELGRLYLQAGDYPAGLRTLKVALSDFPGVSGAAETSRDMARAFQQLFLEGAAEQLSPVAALALYEEFKELTPAGDKGSEMVRRLAERLVQVDLLDRAASLLEGLLAQVAQPEKARLGAQLADIRLRDGKPDAALADLRRTAARDVSADLQRQRSLLQARALGQLGRSEEALQAIAQDESVDAELLRANLHRGRGEWDRTAAALRRVLERARSDPAAALSEQQGREVLDVAVALTLAGSDAQLAELDREYGAAMAATPLKDAFRLIAGSAAPSGADPAALAEMVQKAMAFRKSLGSTPATPSR